MPSCFRQPRLAHTGANIAIAERARQAEQSTPTSPPIPAIQSLSSQRAVFDHRYRVPPTPHDFVPVLGVSDGGLTLR